MTFVILFFLTKVFVRYIICEVQTNDKRGKEMNFITYKNGTVFPEGVKKQVNIWHHLNMDIE